MSDFTPDPSYTRWTPAAQERALTALREMQSAPWHPFYCPTPGCDGHPHMDFDVECEVDALSPHHKWAKAPTGWFCAREGCSVKGRPRDGWTFPHARCTQHPPKGDWLTWFNRGGRGSGKTRTGSEWTHRRTKVSGRIALIAQTGPDARIVMIEGKSGLLATAKPGERPLWEPSKKELTWPNGAKGFVYSAEEPDRLRGPEHFDAWVDEPAHMDNIEDVWANLLFGLRLGERPRICVTTTPKPTKWVKTTIAEQTTVSVVGSTYANIDNLNPVFRDVILKKYEGTRRGRQEIHGEVLADVEGALWQYEYLEPYRLPTALPSAFVRQLDRIVVAIDPAGTHRKKSDETGIVVVGVRVEGEEEEFYVLADYSGKYSPKGWADKALHALEVWSADYLVAETNYGGDMVRHTLETSVDQGVMLPRIVEVNSRRGKVIRADPIVGLYEKGKVHHVGLHLGDLEDQLVGWVPGSESPDRLDALVHGMTDLARTVAPATVATPDQLRTLSQMQTGANLPGRRGPGEMRTA